MPYDNNSQDLDVVLCPKCNKPTHSVRTGTITQWITRCDCDLVAAETEAPVDICFDCGKRKNSGRAGSLTQWIFRTDCCACSSTARKLTLAERVLSNRKVEEAAKSQPESEPEPVEVFAKTDFITSDRYTPCKILGTGASGTVFLCIDKVLNKKVALKKLRQASAITVMDFQQEAQTSSKLHHPNIVSVLDLSTDENGTPYMVMEYVDGVSLETYVQARGPLPIKQVLHIAREICDALGYAHNAGVLHRDVKSSNILLTGEHAFLIDFGIARLKTRPNQTNGDTGRTTIVGSPNYMPPDQGLGLSYDERSEIYSAGCVLFEALTGKPPFSGVSPLEILSLHAHAIPPALCEVCPHIEYPAALESMVAKCLAKDRDKRFQSMIELKSSLLAITVPGTVATESDDRALPPDLMPAETGDSSTNSIVAVITGLLIAAVIGGTASILWVSGKIEQPVVKTAEDFNAVDRQEVIKNAIKQKQTELALSGGFLKDDDIEILKDFQEIKSIDLQGNQVTERGLAYITAPHLETLDISNTDVRTLGFLSRFRNLRKLCLQGTEVNDKELENLKFLPLLKELRLDETELTDRSIDEILKRKTLELISIRNTKFSPQARQRLADHLPMTALDPSKSSELAPLLKKLQAAMTDGKYSEGYYISTQITEKLEKAQGPDAPAICHLLITKAQCAGEIDKYKEMKPLILRAVKIARINDHDVFLRASLRALRTIIARENKMDQAIAIEKEVSSIVERIESPGSDNLTADNLFNLAELYLLADQPGKAEQAYRQYLKTKAGRKTKTRLVWAMAGLAKCALLQNQIDTAEQRLNRTLQLLQHAHLDKPQFVRVTDIDRVIDIHEDLSQCYQRQGSFAKAIEAERNALDVAQKYKRTVAVERVRTRLGQLEQQPPK